MGRGVPPPAALLGLARPAHRRGRRGHGQRGVPWSSATPAGCSRQQLSAPLIFLLFFLATWT